MTLRGRGHYLKGPNTNFNLLACDTGNDAGVVHARSNLLVIASISQGTASCCTFPAWPPPAGGRGAPRRSTRISISRAGLRCRSFVGGPPDSCGPAGSCRPGCQWVSGARAIQHNTERIQVHKHTIRIIGVVCCRLSRYHPRHHRSLGDPAAATWAEPAKCHNYFQTSRMGVLPRLFCLPSTIPLWLQKGPTKGLNLISRVSSPALDQGLDRQRCLPTGQVK